MSQDGSPVGGSPQDVDEQDRLDDEGDREQVCRALKAATRSDVLLCYHSIVQAC